MLAVSAAAIAGIYGFGYAVTTPGTSARQVASQLSLPNGARLADGTWPGESSNGFGSVAVAVRVAGGRIAHVAITSCTTFFPEGYIAGLPAKVVARQSADVDVVSGATASWQDFVFAVRDALGRSARAATPTDAVRTTGSSGR